MADTLDAQTAVRALAGPVTDVGGRFMLHRDTMQFGSDAGFANPLAFYVAGRCGVLGDVDADVVTAALGFFEPATVRSVWDEGVAVAGAREAGHRYAAACAQWGRARLGGFEGAGRLAGLIEQLVAGADVAGLPLFAGWRAVPLPGDAAGRAYQLLQVLREWRGGAHVVAIVSHGIAPVAAVTAKSGETWARMFGWTGDLPDVSGVGEALQAAEDTTDAIVRPAFETALSAAERAELVALVESARSALDAA